MTSGGSTIRRAAIGGSVILIAVALGVLLFSGDDGDDENHVSGPPQTFVLDADSGGAVLRRSGQVQGIAANGDVKWSVAAPKGTQDYVATCLGRCPAAELVFVRSLDDPPVLPDGPRLRLGPPSWKPVAVAPRLRVDRPLLGGPQPLRVTVDRPAGKPRLRLNSQGSVAAPNGLLVAWPAADRRTGLVMNLQGSSARRAIVVRRQATGWAVASTGRPRPPAESACISPDGSRAGFVGSGPPRVASIAGGTIARPRTITGLRPEEENAGTCALAGDTVATAVLSAGGSGGGRIVIRVHAGGRVHTVRRPSSGQPFYDMWVSPRTGTTAVRIGKEVVLVGADGRVRTLRADVAAVAGPGRLLLIRGGRGRTRSF